MTMTPWGESSELRQRRLRPGPRPSKEEVERNRRERLYGATVAVTAEKGYAATSVKDLVAVAGMSRSAFYTYFDDKEGCFLATLEALLDGATTITANRVSGANGLLGSIEAGLIAFIELLVAQPDAARLAMVEAYAAGEAARARVDNAVELLVTLAANVLEADPQRRGMPKELIVGMIGSLRKIIHTRLHRHAEAELPGMIPDLVRLAMLYEPPPQPLQVRGSWAREGSSRPRPGSRGPEQAPERIELATLSLIAEQGYAAATMAAIATEANVSLATFYATFPGKPEAFLAALYRKQLEITAATLPAYKRAPSWPEGIRAIVAACLEFFEREPEFARVATIDVYAAGATALETRDLVIESTQRFIADGEHYAPLENPVAPEAIQSGLYAILQERIRTKGTRGLRTMAPLATYVALAPFIGAEEAATVANGGEPMRREW